REPGSIRPPGDPRPVELLVGAIRIEPVHGHVVDLRIVGPWQARRNRAGTDRALVGISARQHDLSIQGAKQSLARADVVEWRLLVVEEQQQKAWLAAARCDADALRLPEADRVVSRHVVAWDVVDIAGFERERAR